MKSLKICVETLVFFFFFALQQNLFIANFKGPLKKLCCSCNLFYAYSKYIGNHINILVTKYSAEISSNNRKL